MAVWRYDSSGALVDRIRWGCHPEFPNFETLQELTTKDLAKLVRRDMCKEAFETNAQSASAVGLHLFLPISLAEDGSFADSCR